jgi:glycosyltransferase involved in cell wall biosynthesis
VTALATGHDVDLERLLGAHDIDVVFESACFYGARFRIPVVSWMPDFQHRHMPEMFGRTSRLRRDLGFQIQIRSGRTLMVSSDTARNDLERFYLAAKGRGHVVRFAVPIDPAPFLARGDQVCASYSLPKRFFFLPNQFWRHKNHGVIVEALGTIRAAGQLDTLPPVILTGQPKDQRNPAHFDELMARAKALGIESHFRYLGLIPYDDVMALNANCLAMINPSRFEGWSTTIEEAKAFATPLVLADISIHREQAPDARFFDWRSAVSAAEALRELAERPFRPQLPIETLRTAQSARLGEHARALLNTVRGCSRDEPYSLRCVSLSRLSNGGQRRNRDTLRHAVQEDRTASS